MAFLDKLFGDPNEKIIKQLDPKVIKAGELAEQYQSLSDQDLQNKTTEFKDRLAKGETLDDIMLEAFAVVRVAADRALGVNKRLAPHAVNDRQLMGGMVLHQGAIAEMKTGEGKTRTVVPAAYLNSLSGEGVHIITVNDYLAKRDALWMGQVFSLLGLSVACLQQFSAFKLSKVPNDAKDDVQGVNVDMDDKWMEEVPRKEAYQCDVLYGTNSEFGFDYLRDNMVDELDKMVQRPLKYAVIDEVDSILIDEARTPLIISAPAEESSEKYAQFARLVRTLQENVDYNLDEKMRTASLTQEGIAKLEKALGLENIYVESGVATVHHIEQALRAETIFKRDRDYVVKENEIIIVDEFTGRLMHGRRYSEGLHQAIEAKEGVEVQQESQTLATITIQNYFRLYEKLAGMTGTAVTEAEEFSEIYNLDVIVIPTAKPLQRQDLTDRIYPTETAKYKAIINDVKALHEKGQPVLVGTVSINKNELLEELLSNAGIPHEILNAKNHEREAEIIAQAGKRGAVTVATNMAGRGVDIILGGNPPTEESTKEILDLGGLMVIGTERHESRRIDNQLRGRSGRLGDKGVTQFYISLEDDLMRIFGNMDKMKSMMQKMGLPQDMPIENKIVSRSIESAQKKVEGNNFDIRKHVVEYDDVVNKHREIIYKKRREVLELAEAGSVELRERVWELVEGEIEQVVNFHTASDNQGDWNLQEIFEVMRTIWPVPATLIDDLNKIVNAERPDGINLVVLREEIIKHLLDITKVAYDELEAKIVEAVPEATENPMRYIEKRIMLNGIDSLWVEHLEAIDHMKTGIRLRGYAQKDPLVEYKKEGFRMFNQLLNLIQKQVVYGIFKVGVTPKPQTSSLLNRRGLNLSSAPNTSGRGTASRAHGGGQSDDSTAAVISKPKTEDGKKVGRNDPCPCGSGKKYKKCHGA